ncbi:non-specific lipid transfer protein GPI-anchored 5-like [Malania oleifera]|uniref:non-specific lipid transfer protein GPI-anchored 5-like n=1 Tax=Malania oleifera TaxID=397392 RepID=UPI0025ADA9D7|nr:non-specific lipid transfer protein GPI-anchored 5-like [Malania oleifera]
MEEQIGMSGIRTGVVIFLVTVLWAGAEAQSGCSSVMMSLAPCMNYVTGSSSDPSSSCCSQLAAVVRSQPQCLCTALNNGGAAAVASINQTLALALPNACHVQTPPMRQCHGADNGAVGSPEASPGDSPVDVPTNSSAQDGESTSNGNIVEMPLQLAVFLLLMASYASTFCTY